MGEYLLWQAALYVKAGQEQKAFNTLEKVIALGNDEQEIEKISILMKKLKEKQND